MLKQMAASIVGLGVVIAPVIAIPEPASADVTHITVCNSIYSYKIPDASFILVQNADINRFLHRGQCKTMYKVNTVRVYIDQAQSYRRSYGHGYGPCIHSKYFNPSNNAWKVWVKSYGSKDC